jgi:hypothetical protein
VRQTLRALVGSMGSATGETLAHSIAVSVYDQVGAEFFTTLVDRFYDAVERDPVLRPLYPDDADALALSRAHLRGFLVQYWGGPTTYSDERHLGGFASTLPDWPRRARRGGHMADAVRSMGAARSRRRCSTFRPGRDSDDHHRPVAVH